MEEGHSVQRARASSTDRHIGRSPPTNAWGSFHVLEVMAAMRINNWLLCVRCCFNCYSCVCLLDDVLLVCLINASVCYYFMLKRFKQSFINYFIYPYILNNQKGRSVHDDGSGGGAISRRGASAWFSAGRSAAMVSSLVSKKGGEDADS